MSVLFDAFQQIAKPFIAIKNKITGVKVEAGNLKVESEMIKGYGAQAKGTVDGVNAKLGAGPAAAQGAQDAMSGAGAAPPGGINPNPPIKTSGFWVFKKKQCSQCNQPLDASWDACPYCAQAAQQQAAAAAAANKPKAPSKTQAFMINAPGGAASGMQLLGWIVPMQGPQKGELFTLSPATVIGKDPTCNIVLQDSFMSSKHAEIKAEAGIWVLKDMGSTNGTFVNDKRVDKQELVDNDMIMFGKCLVKFKSL